LCCALVAFSFCLQWMHDIPTCLPCTGRFLFDAAMFGQLWGPAVAAMCAMVDAVRSAAGLEAALEGLTAAAGVAATHEVPDVADTIMTSLAKIPMQVGGREGALGLLADCQFVNELNECTVM
jgi:hypothetical protein